MANVPTETAARGYEMFCEAGGDISIEILNSRLQRAGHPEISHRTFTHYKHMHRDGYSNYLTINEYDQERKRRLIAQSGT